MDLASGLQNPPAMMLLRALILSVLTTLLLLHLHHMHSHLHSDRQVHVHRCGTDRVALAATPVPRTARPATARAATRQLAPETMVVDIQRATVERMRDHGARSSYARLAAAADGHGARLLVTRVRPGSLSELIGLRSGDIITAINNRPPSLESVLAAAQLPDFLDLSIKRRGRPLRVVVLMH
ncbi:MAG: PDZ domain-containing protein [Myxococcota bacterium]